MSAEALHRAKSEAVAARARFLATLGQTQTRLKPGNLAGEAVGGLKRKSAEVAGNAVEAVKRRPVTVSLVLGGLLLFLARAPLKRAAVGLVGRRRRKGNKDGD